MKDHILLLHGALGCSKQLAPLEQLLSPHYTVHCLNFEGHGGDVITNDFSIDLFANNVLNYLKEQQIDSCHIFGYSMGGYVALHLVNHYDVTIKSIITLGTKFNWSPEISAKEVKMLNPDKIAEKVPKFAGYLQQLHQEQWKNVVLQTAKLMHDLGNESKLNDEEFESIKTNTLIGIGNKDVMVSLEESKHVSQLLPHAQLKVYENFEHPIERVDIAHVANEIKSFTKAIK